MRAVVPGVQDMCRGETYITFGKGSISWGGAAVSVKERALEDEGGETCARRSILCRHSWRICGCPPQIEDGLGRVLPLQTEHALFRMFDGTHLLVSHEGDGPVTGVRIYEPDVAVAAHSMLGICPRRTTVYANRGFAKRPIGMFTDLSPID